MPGFAALFIEALYVIAGSFSLRLLVSPAPVNSKRCSAALPPTYALAILENRNHF